MANYFGKDVFKLGFGLMRLPKNADGSIDIPHTSAMVDKFIAAGGTYFDTAYVYDNGESEKAAKAALVDRYPRDSFTLCTKLCAWLQCLTKQARSSSSTRAWSVLEQGILITICFMRCSATTTKNTMSTTSGIL